MAASDWFNESDWGASENPHHLLAILMRRVVMGGRRFRLTALACCRRGWEQLPDPLRESVDVGERYADREATFAQVRAAAERCGAVGVGPDAKAVLGALHREPRIGVQDTVYSLLGVAWGGPRLPELRPARSGWGGAWELESRAMADIVRDIFGNPFRPVATDRSWLTSTVVELARGVYAERASDGLPILADALQDAGCDDGQILGHCRAPGPHVRGCWVVDLLLGKK